MAEQKKIITNQDDFALFVSECGRWIEIYGLKQWEVTFRHEKEECSFGSCVTNLTGRAATITLSTEWSQKDYGINNILHTAFHEATELLMAEMIALANYRYTTEDEIETASHSVIRTLEKVLYPKYREKA